MPFTDTIGQFSHDGVRWLNAHPDLRASLDSFEDSPLSLNDVLRLTLPSVEQARTTAGMTNGELLKSLHIPSSQWLAFILDQLSRLDDQPLIKDHLFDRLAVFVRLHPLHARFSKAMNFLEQAPLYFHHALVKKFDFLDLIRQPLPQQAIHSPDAIRIIKNAMALTARETDPTTFMTESSLKLYYLDRGITVAIYDMVPSRQLPLESYVGFTAFKNGYPCAYGGAWVFGEMAIFGMNIFESYRGGESGYVMGQLLRVYRQVFGLRYVEVEPYQFGLDNPDGITSGAFWFYYRFGFRPLDKRLRQKAASESKKIAARKGYRTSEKTLIEFTGSNLGLLLEGQVPPKVTDVFARISRMIHKQFKGNRSQAEAECLEKLLRKTGLAGKLTPEELTVGKETGLLAEACPITEPAGLKHLADMIRYKPVDVYLYQHALVKFLRALPAK